MTKKKIILIILAVVLVALVGTGIYIAVSGDSASSKEPGLYINGKKTDDTVLMTVDGVPVDFDVYRYFYMNLYQSAINQNADYFKDDANFAEFKTTVESYVRDFYLNKKLIEENNIVLSEEDEAKVQSTIEQTRNAYPTEEEYLSAMEKAYCTPELFETIQRMAYQINEYILNLYKDDVAAETLRAKHILIKFADYPGADDTENNPNGLTEEEWVAENEKNCFDIATEVAEKAKNGEDFDTLITEYNEDPGMESNPDGYYFIEGNMVSEFYEGTKALNIGEISDPVKTTYGYHIILRLEPQPDAIEANTLSMISSSQVYNDKYMAYMDTETQKQQIVYSDNYALLTADSIK